MNYKVVILLAGRGTRVPLSENFHKSFISYNYKPIISHIIDKYNSNTKFVLVLGHNYKIILNYIKVAHPNMKFEKVIIRDYYSSASGPGKSLYAAKSYLSCPFISHACDTLVKEKIVPNKFNWIGISKNISKDFLGVKIKDRKVKEFSSNYTNKFIGLCCIHDYKKFWDSLKKSLKSKNYEMIGGFNQILLNDNLLYKKFSWYDFGNEKSISSNLKKLENKKIINYLPKNDELLFFYKKRVIKIFKDKSKAKKRFIRSHYIKSLLPKKIFFDKNILSYEYFKGSPMHITENYELFNKILHKIKKNIWQSNYKLKISKKGYKYLLQRFYHDKTYTRVNLFLKDFHYYDKYQYINNVKVPKILDILKKVDWESLYENKPSKFHGDLALNNIITDKNKFCLIDWREDFAGNINVGDMYYDLSKLYHTFFISQRLEMDGSIQINRLDKKIYFKFKSYSNLLKYKKVFEKFVLEYDFDLYKIKILTNLIYLNIASLHNGNYSKLLFLYGKLNLWNIIKYGE